MANLSNGENLNNQLGSKIIDDYGEKFLLGLVSIRIILTDTKYGSNIPSMTRYRHDILVFVLGKAVFSFDLACDRKGEFIFSRKKIQDGNVIKKYR